MSSNNKNTNTTDEEITPNNRSSNATIHRIVCRGGWAHPKKHLQTQRTGKCSLDTFLQYCRRKTAVCARETRSIQQWLAHPEGGRGMILTVRKSSRTTGCPATTSRQKNRARC